MNEPRCGGAGCGMGGDYYAELMRRSKEIGTVKGHPVIIGVDRAVVGEDYPTLGTLQTDKDVRDYNIGGSDYAAHKIQPWDIWKEYNLNPWDADIIKRILRDKEGDSRELDYEKIKHICDERIRQIREETNE